MKKKYFKRGIASLGLGVFLVALSMYSSSYLIKADGSGSVLDQGIGTTKIVLSAGVIMIGISVSMFMMAVSKSE
jgi:hypothetical protein